MSTNEPAPSPVRGSPRTVLPYLALAAGLEILILYLLIAVETPVTPLIRRALKNPAGLFAVVMIALTMVCVIMAGLLSWGERIHKRDASRLPPSGSETPPDAP